MVAALGLIRVRRVELGFWGLRLGVYTVYGLKGLEF